MKSAVPRSLSGDERCLCSEIYLLCPFDPMIAGNSRGNQEAPVHAAVATVFDWRCSQFRELSGLIYRIRVHSNPIGRVFDTMILNSDWR